MTKVGLVYVDSIGRRWVVDAVSDHGYASMTCSGHARGMSLETLAYMIGTAQLRIVD